MEDYITRREHDEYAKRMEDEHRRINHRLTELEKVQESNNRLLTNVEKLALSMEHMQKEQKEQGERLEKLEGRDGEKWRKIAGHALTTATGILIGYILKQVGIF